MCVRVRACMRVCLCVCLCVEDNRPKHFPLRIDVCSMRAKSAVIHLRPIARKIASLFSCYMDRNQLYITVIFSATASGLQRSLIS